MNFAKNLENLRRSRGKSMEYGLSQAKLARDTGLTRSMIASYEQGVAEPNFCNLLKIAEYFDVSLDSLINK